MATKGRVMDPLHGPACDYALEVRGLAAQLS